MENSLNFIRLMKDIKVADILNDDGRLVMAGILGMAMDPETADMVKLLSKKVIRVVDGTPWVHSAVALIFCLDMILQTNPISCGDEEAKLAVEGLEKKVANGEIGGW